MSNTKVNSENHPQKRSRFLPVRLWTIKPHRLEAFSDGVFAIVATLLVIEIRVPEVHNGSVSQELAKGLIHLSPKILSYIMSFLYIGIYWINHHLLFQVLTRVNLGIFWCNNIFLLCLAFIPFPTALIGEYPQEPIAVLFYGVVMLLTGCAFFIMKWYAVDRCRLTDPAYGEHVFRQTILRILIGPILYLAAIGLAFLSTSLAILIYIAVPVIYLFPEKLEKM